jgi:hypothetical protein
MLFLVFVTHVLQFVILGTLAPITLTMPLIVYPLSPHAGGYYGISGLPDKRLDSFYRKRRSNLSNKSKFCFPQIQISTAPKMSGLLLRLTGSEPCIYCSWIIHWDLIYCCIFLQGLLHMK